MTDEELADIQIDAIKQDQNGTVADPQTVLALVAEVRRLNDEHRRALEMLVSTGSEVHRLRDVLRMAGLLEQYEVARTRQNL